MITRVLGAIFWKLDVRRALSLHEWLSVLGVATLAVMTLVFTVRAIGTLVAL